MDVYRKSMSINSLLLHLHTFTIEAVPVENQATDLERRFFWRQGTVTEALNRDLDKI